MKQARNISLFTTQNVALTRERGTLTAKLDNDIMIGIKDKVCTRKSMQLDLPCKKLTYVFIMFVSKKTMATIYLRFCFIGKAV